MNLSELYRKFPLHSIFLLGMALVFSIPYRVSLVVQPAWLAYGLLTGLLVALFSLFLIRPKELQRSISSTRWLSLSMLTAAALPRIYWMSKIPVEANYGDMLPLIQLAGERFLAGEYPYSMYDLPWPLPLTFFPGLWMSYLPAIATGMDLRLIGLVCTLGCVCLMLRSVASRWHYAVILAFCLLPVFSFFTANGHTQPFWLMLCAFAFCYLRAMPIRSAFFLGLALATRQTALILFPFAVLGWWREIGFRQSLKPILITCAVTGTFCLPFFLINPEAFLFEPLRHYHELATAYREGVGDPAKLLETFGFANLFYITRWSHLLGWGRLVVFLAGVAGCFRFARGPADHIRWMAVTGLLFTLFTPIPWIYAYFPFWILAFFHHTIGCKSDKFPRR